MKGLGQYARHVGMLVGQSFVQRVLGMVTSIILARVLGATNLGIYGIVSTTSNSVYGLSRLGIDAALHVTTAEGYAGADEQRRMEEMLGAGLLLLGLGGVLGGLACAVLSGQIASFLFDRSDLAVWIQIAGIAVVLLSLSQFCYAALAGLHRFAEYSLVMLVSAVVNLAAISFGAYLAGVSGAVLGLILAQAASTIGLAIATRMSLRKQALSLRFGHIARRAGTLLRFGVPYYVAGTIAIPGAYAAQGLMVRHAGLEAVGYLRVVVAITTIVSFVPTSAAAAIISMFARARVQSAEGLGARIMQNIRLIFALAVTTAICLAAVLPWLIPLVFGENYAAAVGPATLALVTAVLAATHGIVLNALLSARKVFTMGMLSLMQAGLFIVLALSLIPTYGLTGFILSELGGFALPIGVAAAASASWFRAGGVSIGWIAWATVPLGLLAVHAVRRLSGDGAATSEELLTGLAFVGFSLVWSYFFLLQQQERTLLSPGLLLKRARCDPADGQ